ncbi:hypothetical protein [Paenibacillus sp. AN1007]|uniref:DUF5105 domain-containing protein n=1 Tax=Paenibacillus sp. AN1007 TaxID=3151385 RepID=A0AAU8NCS9_9BACL
MKFQKSIISVIAILSVALSSGCGQNESQEKISNNQEMVNTTNNSSPDKVGSKTILFNKEFSQKETELSTFKEGVFIDLSTYVKDLFTKDIAEKIQYNMNAIVKHDQTKFKENMLDEDSIKVNLDWFKYKYEDGVKFEFNELNGITYDEDAKRIQVVVTFYRNIKDERVEQGVLTYSLLKEKNSGTWLIATLDGN